MTITRGRFSYYRLTNKSGGSVTVGQAVTVYTSADNAFTTSTSQLDLTIMGTVIDATIANNADGLIQVHGAIVSVLCAAAVTRGHYVRQSATAGKVETCNMLARSGSIPPFGAVGIALTGAGSAGTITVYAFPSAVARLWSLEQAPASANAMDDEFSDYVSQSGVVLGLDSKWAWRNQGTATATFPQQGVLKLGIPASATNNIRILEQAIPADSTYIVACTLEADATDFALAGMCMVDGVNGDLYAAHLAARTVASNIRISFQVSRWTNVTTYLSDALTIEIPAPGNFAWIKMQLTGGNIVVSMSTSANGDGWLRLGSFADAVVVTKVGLMVNESNNTGRTAGYFRHFRRTA